MFKGNKKKLQVLLSTAIILVTLVGCGTAKKTNGYIAQDGVLKVAMECAYAPYNWTQKDDANGAVPIVGSSEYANGYDVMIAKKIAEAMNLQVQIVKSDWDSLIPAVQSGLVDCAIAGQSIKPERLQNVDFTNPYYYANVVVLSKKDGKYNQAKRVEDLKGAKVTSQLNTIWYNNCLPQIPEAEILAGQADAPTMLIALEAGSVDIVVTDQPTAQAALLAYSDLKILDLASDHDFVVDDADINIGISLRKGNKILTDKLNKALEFLNQEVMNEYMSKAISIQPLNK